MVVGDLEVVKFGLRLIRFGVICANGLNDHIVRQIVLFTGVDRHGLGCELFIVRHITVENGLVALVMVKQPHQPFLAFSTEDRICQGRITELYVEQADVGDLKSGVIQIDGIANLERNTGGWVSRFGLNGAFLCLLHHREIARVEIAFKGGAVDLYRFLFGYAR